MSDELMNRARELLALRDKATPGPWGVRTLDGSLGSIDAPGGITVAQAQEISVSDRNGGHQERRANASLIATAHDMADTIRDLLAEVERLTAMATALKLLTNRLDQDRADLSARAEAAETACENLGSTPKQAAEGLARYKAREARIAELESRLRELASAEPVLWTDEAEECVEYTPREWASVALIRRPEMP